MILLKFSQFFRNFPDFFLNFPEILNLSKISKILKKKFKITKLLTKFSKKLRFERRRIVKNLVDLPKCCRMSIWLPKSALVPPRTSLSKLKRKNEKKRSPTGAASRRRPRLCTRTSPTAEARFSLRFLSVQNAWFHVELPLVRLRVDDAISALKTSLSQTQLACLRLECAIHLQLARRLHAVFAHRGAVFLRPAG